jgi:hypothetical protein
VDSPPGERRRHRRHDHPTQRLIRGRWPAQHTQATQPSSPSSGKITVYRWSIRGEVVRSG